MARLSGSLVSSDDAFKKELIGLLRSVTLAVHVGDDRPAARGGGAHPDVFFVDARGDVASAIGQVERLRALAPTAGIFFVARDNNPDVIVKAMRAGANEFFTWPVSRDLLDEALGRADARKAAVPGAAGQGSTIVFFGAKGGSGTTTVAVNTAVELARIGKKPTVVVDLKPGLGEVGLFLGVRSRYTLVDALDNLHRLDAEFLRELVVRHKSGVEILAGSELFDRPGAGDSGALEEVLALLGRQYDYVVIDAGSHLNPCAVAGLYAADMVCLVATPDVPSVRNAQRLLDRIAQLGPSGERVRVLLNRAAEPYPIPPSQIESALGHPIFNTFPSDYKTVSTALNSGVPLAMASNPEMAAQFDRFIRRILSPNVTAMPSRKSTLGLERIASLW
jgi:pilus assembly protein CpaE